MNLYFNNENALVVNKYLKDTFTSAPTCDWIVKRAKRYEEDMENGPLEKLLSQLNSYVSKARAFSSTEYLMNSRHSEDTKTRIIMNVFLSSIIIYRTVTFTE